MTFQSACAHAGKKAVIRDSIEGVVKIRILHPLNSFMFCTCELSSANETWLFCLQAEFARLLTSIMSTASFSSFYSS